MQHNSTTTSATLRCACLQCIARCDSQPVRNIWTRYPTPRKDPCLMVRLGKGGSQTAHNQHPSGLYQKVLTTSRPTIPIPVTSSLADEDPRPVEFSDPSSLTKDTNVMDLDLDETLTLDNFELAYPEESCAEIPSSTGTPIPWQKLQVIHSPAESPPVPDPSPQIPSPGAHTFTRNLVQVNQHTSLPLWNSLPLEPLTRPPSTSAPPNPHNGIRTCITKNCAGLIVPSSTCLRCVRCILADWRARKAKGFLLPKPPRAPPNSILRTGTSRRSKGKSVSWADQRIEDDRQHQRSPDNWVSGIKRVRLKLPDPTPPPSVVNGAELKGLSPEMEHTGSKCAGPEETLPTPDHNSNETPAVTDQSLAAAYQTHANPFLDDSDLSDLTDISSESSASESEESAEPQTSDESPVSSAEQSVAPIKLTIRLPARSPTVAPAQETLSPHRKQSMKFGEIPYTQCSTANCGRYLPPVHENGICIWCRLEQKWQKEKTVHQENQKPVTPTTSPSLWCKAPPIIDIINQELLSGDVVSGARICSSCQHIMPPFSEYPDNTCHPCQFNSKRQQVESAIKSWAELPPDLSSGEKNRDTTLGNENILPDPGLGRCRSRDCGVVVHGSLECWQCMTRRANAERERGKMQSDPGTVIKTEGHRPTRTPTETSCLRQKRSRPLHLFTPYPEYRCQHELLVDFRTKIFSFLEVRNTRTLHEPHGNPEMTVFGFDGQFSVVALDSDLLGRKDVIELGVLNLKRELERIGTLQFNPEKYVTINESGIFTRFLCVHRIYDPFGPPYPDQEPKVMQGELEIAKLPDRSHRFLPGEKTVIRLRLVGWTCKYLLQ